MIRVRRDVKRVRLVHFVAKNRWQIRKDIY